MKARYQYRFYPTDQQQKGLAQLFGCVRVVWNDALALCKASGKAIGFNKLSAMLTQSKKAEERQWLKDVSSVPLQQSLRYLDVAYRNFFNSLKGKRRGEKVGSPKFKKKTNNQSAEFTKAAFSLSGDSVYLAKIGDIKPVWSRKLPSEPSSVTVIKECANRYFLSFVVDIEPEHIEPINPSVGIDLGIKTFAVLSTGEKFQSPDYSRLDKKVRKLQRKLARQSKGSNRRNKTRLRIAKKHNKIREFRTLCEAKSEKYGRTFSTVSRWEPTSQICSHCGYQWGKLDLSIRTVTCLSCGTTHDRDENAAKNIDKVGIGNCYDSKRTRRDNKTTLVASLSDALRITVASAR